MMAEDDIILLMGERHFDSRNVPKLKKVITDTRNFFGEHGYPPTEIFVVGSQAKEMRREYYSGRLLFVKNPQKLIREAGIRESDLDILVKTEEPLEATLNSNSFFNESDKPSKRVDIWYNQDIEPSSEWVRIYPSFDISE